MVSSNRIIHSTYTQSFHNFFFSVIFDSNRFPLDDTNPIKKKDWEWKRTNLNNKIIETSKPSNRLVSGLVWFGLIWLFARGKKIISSIFFFRFKSKKKNKNCYFGTKKKRKKNRSKQNRPIDPVRFERFFFLGLWFRGEKIEKILERNRKKTEKLFSRIVFGFFFWFKLFFIIIIIYSNARKFVWDFSPPPL